jgi:Mrp family chromosome partitioning ATPase
MSQASDAIGHLGAHRADAAGSVEPRVRRTIDHLITASPSRPEFVRLFHAVSSLNSRDQPFVLQFLSSTKGEGTSTVAANFVRAATAEHSRWGLLIDCAPRGRAMTQRPRSNRPSLIEAFQSSGTIEAAIHAVPGNSAMMVARLAYSANPLVFIDAAELRRLFDLIKQTFPIIALDCSPVDECPDSLAMARHCDGTVLVVRAETTPRNAIVETRVAIDRFGGQLIGLVFNRCRTYLPAWLRWVV